MKEKTKIILLSGFLGSGKTTLLKHIMAFDTDMSDTVIIMNEVGEVGIDGLLIKNLGCDVVELTSGCICCSMSDDLQESIQEILNHFGPRYIIIEATGVADPAAVSEILATADFKDQIELHKVITVMDAECWEVRNVFGTLFFRQLNQADTIIFNKVDLLDKNDIANFLSEIHQSIPNAQVIPAVNCSIEPEVLWTKPNEHNLLTSESDIQQNECTRCKNGTCGDHINHHKTTFQDHAIFTDKSYVTFSFTESTPMNETAFKSFVAQMPWELFRLKGTVNFGDHSMMINSVAGKTEWQPWEKEVETRLAFVGWNIKADDFLSQLKKCVRNK